MDRNGDSSEWGAPISNKQLQQWTQQQEQRFAAVEPAGNYAAPPSYASATAQDEALLGKNPYGQPQQQVRVRLFTPASVCMRCGVCGSGRSVLQHFPVWFSSLTKTHTYRRHTTIKCNNSSKQLFPSCPPCGSASLRYLDCSQCRLTL